MTSKTAIVATVKTDRLELTSFVHYHLNIGIDLIILFFDDPSDPLLSLFEAYGRVVAVACNDEYESKFGPYRSRALAKRQRINANAGLRYARENGCDWLFHIDSDEFIDADSAIGDLLAHSGSDVVRLDVHEAIPERETFANPYSEIRLFRRRAAKYRIWLCRFLGCPRALFSGCYFRGHTNSKIAFRTDMDIKSVGVHGVTTGERKTRETEAASIRLLHFDSVTFEVWKNKWVMRSDAKELKPKDRKACREHQFALYQRFSDNETMLRKAYRRIYRLTAYDKVILNALGMLRSFRLAPILFECPPDEQSPIVKREILLH